MTLEGEIKLRDFEGLRLKPFTDTAGKLTIGWGRNLTDRGISYDEAKMLFQTDLEIAIAEARSNFSWFDGLDLVRQDVIVIMIFNIGVPRLKSFKKMLAAFERQDWSGAAAELLDSEWARQVQPTRVEATRIAIQTGKWE